MLLQPVNTQHIGERELLELEIQELLLPVELLQEGERAEILGVAVEGAEVILLAELMEALLLGGLVALVGELGEQRL